MICVLMKLNKYAEKHGKMNIFIFVLIDLKREIKEDIVFVMKTRTHTLEVPLKQTQSSFCNLTSTQKHSLFLFQR